MTQPIPLQYKEMDSAPWKHWVEHIRRIPVIELSGSGVQRYSFTRSGAFDVTQACPFDGPVLVTSNIGANRVTANGVVVWGPFASPCPTYLRVPRGIGAIILPGIKAGQDVRWEECWGTGAYSWFVHGYQKMWMQFEKLRDAVSMSEVLLPPHPRLKTEDRRWVDHWIAAYKKIDASTNEESKPFTHVDQGRLSSASTSVTTLVSVTTTRAGVVDIVADSMGWSATKYAAVTTTFSIKVNGVALDSIDVTESGTVNKDLFCDLTIIGATVAEGDVITFERSSSNNLAVEAYLGIWYK